MPIWILTQVDLIVIRLGTPTKCKFVLNIQQSSLRIFVSMSTIAVAARGCLKSFDIWWLTEKTTPIITPLIWQFLKSINLTSSWENKFRILISTFQGLSKVWSFIYLCRKPHFCLYIIRWFSLWFIDFVFTAFSHNFKKTRSVLVPTVISITEISYVADGMALLAKEGLHGY